MVVDASKPSEESIAQIQSWVQELYDYLPEDLPIFVVANKIDLELDHSRLSTTSQTNTGLIRAFVKTKGYSFLRASAKANPHSIDQIFDRVLAKIWLDLRTCALKEKEMKQGRGKEADDKLSFGASNIFDDDNSKDLGRRQSAFLQNCGIVQDRTIDQGDASFKLKKINH